MRQAFTLVELAIVLVIIGLLVGGVLVGQDLIKSAAINATVSDLQSYTAAALTFRDKYNGIPGDLSKAKAQQAGLTISAVSPGSWGEGDGDGSLQNGVGGSGQSTVYTTGMGGEILLFWRQLSDAGLIPFTSTATGAAIDTTNFATAGLAQSTLLPLIPQLRIRPTGFVDAAGVGNLNYYMIGSFGACNGSTWGNVCDDSVFSGNEARALDTKLDDGYPATGTVLSARNGSPWGPYSPQPGNGSSGSGSPNYNTTNTTCYDNSTTAGVYGYGDIIRCALRIRAGF